ncbi:MAG: hypothetical protein JWO12_496 [Frankiales bacterium]|nr:hypothetical protein [Frankiales bacterium]
MTAPGIRLVLREVHEGEQDLEKQLHAVADRHRTDHEVRHVAIDLARWSLLNRQALAPFAGRYGDELGRDQHPAVPSGVLSAVRERSAELVGRRSAPGLLLLRDLRELYLLASGNSVLWTMLGQAAQTVKDKDLLGVVTECHDRTMRQAVWCNATIKVLSPQLLTSL